MGVQKTLLGRSRIKNAFWGLTLFRLGVGGGGRKVPATISTFENFLDI